MARLQLKFNTTATTTTHGLFTLIIIFLIIPVLVLSDDKGQRDYMLKLMRSLSPTPSNWSDKTNICSGWSGVYCYYGHVDRIDLSSMSLKGTLPSGLNDSLISLTQIDLRNNSLSGPLPSLANLGTLHEVYLNDNNFTSIPHGCFQGLLGLQTLDLSNNLNLAPWNFPNDLNHSSALLGLDLSATNLLGSLPDHIFHSFPNLVYVNLSNNSLNGVLPESFATSKIQWLDLSYNNLLSGSIEILSSMTQLSFVQLQGNRFEGPIPDLSNCSQLQRLNLKDNQLTGVVPPSLMMNLSQLLTVSLDNNWLQGPLPVFDSSVDVSTSSNSFCLEHAGPCDERVNTLLQIAAAFGYPLLLARSWRGNDPCKGWRFITCDDGGSMIRTVNLTKLNLTGTISDVFANLTDLQNLYLDGNNLQGSIPESLASLPQLQVLDVSYNNLSGNIPRFPHKVLFSFNGNSLLRHPRSATHPWIAAGASAGGAGVIVMFVIFVYSMMFKKSRAHIDQNVEDFIKSYEFLVPKRYSYLEVKKMTNSFRDKLGQGGYGTVFKATLADDRQVAVKVLSETKGSGEEFINEVASISRTSHVNIVSLLGFCFEINRRALIYEFMSNGSLDNFIYGKGSPTMICDLEWSTLYKIAIGVARGLEYLHQGCSTRILHLDIKPQNILLDENFCPKICDFGLAKICRKKESIVSVLGPRGTIGYIAPEVFSRAYGGVSHKSDVYSYGMLILDIVGGRKNYYNGSDTTDMYFPDWIYKDLEQGNIPAKCLVRTDEENDMVMKIILVSLWCTQQNPSDRPSMSKVVEMLEGPLESVPYPPKSIMCSPEMPLLKSLSYSDILETNSMSALENGSIQ